MVTQGKVQAGRSASSHAAERIFRLLKAARQSGQQESLPHPTWSPTELLRVEYVSREVSHSSHVVTSQVSHCRVSGDRYKCSFTFSFHVAPCFTFRVSDYRVPSRHKVHMFHIAGCFTFHVSHCRMLHVSCFTLQGFFKRSTLRGDKYKCFFGGQCVLSPQNRNRCKACRFQRCLNAGMSLDGAFPCRNMCSL